MEENEVLEKPWHRKQKTKMEPKNRTRECALDSAGSGLFASQIDFAPWRVSDKN
jgi:hypothetical protein